MRTAPIKTILGAFICAGIIAAAAATAHANCKAPRVLIVLDKSSSMLGKVGNATKWSIAKSALATVLGAYDRKADFGLMIFPSPSQCGPGTVKVSIGPAKGTAILNQLTGAPPASGNWTPMAQSLDAAPSVKALQDSAYPKHVLLITDGWQWCSPYQNSTRFLPVNSVTNLKALGITTHVVGFGDGVDALTLNKMAQAAGTKVSNTCDVTGSDPKGTNNCYYQANNHQQLLAALQSIAKKITAERCDGIDNDCNGKIDDGLSGPSCPKQRGVCYGATRICNGGGGWQPSCSDQIYRDHAALSGNAYEANETLCDGKDNDCDGTVDEGCSCVNGATRPCGVNKGTCVQGTQTCQNGQWSACVGETKPANEVCDGKDNNCDGNVDEGLTRSCASKCGAGIETCNGGQWSSCTAQKPTQEICDGIDNDCDGTVDGPNAICDNGGTCVQGTCVPPKGPVGDGGCDCRVGSSGSGTLPVTGLLLGLGLLLVRRRRRRRK